MNRSASAIAKQIEKALEDFRLPAARILNQLTGSQVAPAGGSARGTIQLARDLGGVASAPEVVGLQGRDVSATAPGDGQGLVWDAGASAWAPASIGGSGGMQILSVQADSSSNDGGTPVNATLVPDLTIAIAGSGTARRALVSFSFAYTASHTNHVNLFRDTTIVFPKTGISSFPGTIDAADSVYALGPSDSSPTTYYATLSEYVVHIPGDSAAHDIIVKYSAAISTAATTFYARSLVVKLIYDSDDVTI